MGKVIGEKGAAVEEATISLCENGTTLILAYTFTDRNGSFTLSWNHPFDSLLLRVSCVGFTSLHRTITRGDRNIEFQLKVQVAVLREVKIKNTPVWKRKDTLN